MLQLTYVSHMETVLYTMNTEETKQLKCVNVILLRHQTLPATQRLSNTVELVLAEAP